MTLAVDQVSVFKLSSEFFHLAKVFGQSEDNRLNLFHSSFKDSNSLGRVLVAHR